MRPIEHWLMPLDIPDQRCDLGEYYDGYVCDACDSSCLTCDGPSATSCTSCPLTYDAVVSE